ncbi:MAG: cobyrinate a,c-diamide synthase [Veillonellaceae bacterium]|nr:cobyrinate a,c-diamide synthase [Veillonellaceae bacterium]
MQAIKLPRIVIAGTSSGVGKTTIVTGLLGALKQSGRNVQSYKVGPDYIDPGYHFLASGKPSHNLDTWLIPEEKLTAIFTQTAKNSDLALIEGVMGLYDGGRKGISSTASIAKLLKAPVVLVIDAKSMGESAAAIALGYKMYDSNINLAGVILNRLGSLAHRDMICQAMDKLGIEVLGCIFRNDALSMPERHLGLTPITENCATNTVNAMTEQIGAQVNLARIVEISENTDPIVYSSKSRPVTIAKTVRIGVAQDEAFSFYYPESLETLESLGAELVPFSPLNDTVLPNVDGLILGGGFPEMFVKQLTQNNQMRSAILEASKCDMPIYAECGGLMYLTRQVIDFDGNVYDMVGAIPAICTMESKLQTVGYIEASPLKTNVLANPGNVLRGHEFHFSRMIPDCPDSFPWAFEIKKMRTGAIYNAGYSDNNLLASYLHIHFAGNLDAAAQFIRQCQQYRKTHK